MELRGNSLITGPMGMGVSKMLDPQIPWLTKILMVKFTSGFISPASLDMTRA